MGMALQDREDGHFGNFNSVWIDWNYSIYLQERNNLVYLFMGTVNLLCLLLLDLETTILYKNMSLLPEKNNLNIVSLQYKRALSGTSADVAHYFVVVDNFKYHIKKTDRVITGTETGYTGEVVMSTKLNFVLTKEITVAHTLFLLLVMESLEHHLI